MICLHELLLRWQKKGIKNTVMRKILQYQGSEGSGQQETLLNNESLRLDRSSEAVFLGK